MRRIFADRSSCWYCLCFFPPIIKILARHYSRCEKQPLCSHQIKPKNSFQLIQNRQGCGLVAKNTAESRHASGSIKGRAEEEEKKRNKKGKNTSRRSLSNSSIVSFSNKCIKDVKKTFVFFLILLILLYFFKIFDLQCQCCRLCNLKL